MRFLLILGIISTILAAVIAPSPVSLPTNDTNTAKINDFSGIAFAQTCSLNTPFNSIVTVNPTSANPSQSVILTASMCQYSQSGAYRYTAPLECRFQYNNGGGWQSAGTQQCSQPEGDDTWEVSLAWPANFGSSPTIQIRVEIYAGQGGTAPTECQYDRGRPCDSAQAPTPITRIVAGLPTITVSPSSVSAGPPNYTYSVSATLANPRESVTWSWEPPLGHTISGSCTNTRASSSCNFVANNRIGGTGRVSATGAQSVAFNVSVQQQNPPQELQRADCGCSLQDWSIRGLVLKAICEATCAVSQAIGGLVEFFVNGLLNAAGVSWIPKVDLAGNCRASETLSFFIPTAYAQSNTITPPNFSPGDLNLAQQLDPARTQHRWLRTIWNIAIGLVNVGVVLFIIFIALATILHWNIDTYGFKKALPGLVIGVILANFSLTISRGLVDVATVLTSTLAGQPQELATGLIRALGLAGVTGITGLAAGIVLVIVGGPFGLLTLLAGIILIFLPALLVAVMWFLFIIRIGVVLVLAAISPLAFASLGFPGTQGWFKRWWSMYLNWVFMAPVVFLLFRIASEVGRIRPDVPAQESLGSVVISLVISMGLLWMAIQVPFKMGGAIMAAWGGLGKAAAGLGRKGYGSLAAKGAGWAKDKDASAFKRGAGKLLSSTNLYGAKAALQERLELGEAARVKAFKDSPQYQRLAGYEAAYRYRLKDNADAIRNIDNLEDVQDSLNDLNKEGQIDKLRAWASDFAQKEGKGTAQQVLQEFFYRTGPTGQARILSEAGINSDQASRIVLTAQQAQKLLTRRFQPTPIWETLDAALVEKDLTAHAQRVRESHRTGGIGRREGENGGTDQGGGPRGRPSPTPGSPSGAAGAVFNNYQAGFRAMQFNDANIADILEQIERGHPTQHIAERMRAGYDEGGRVVDPARAAAFSRLVNQARIDIEAQIDRYLEGEAQRLQQVADALRTRRPDTHSVANVENAMRDFENALQQGTGTVSRATVDAAIDALHAVRPELTDANRQQLAQNYDQLINEMKTTIGAADLAGLPPGQVRAAARSVVRENHELRRLRATIRSTVEPQQSQAAQILVQAASDQSHPLYKTTAGHLTAIVNAHQQKAAATGRPQQPVPNASQLLTELGRQASTQPVQNVLAETRLRDTVFGTLQRP